MSEKRIINVSPLDVAWLAGLLEGEGCFRTSGKRSPTIHLNMTDLDIVLRVAALWTVDHISTTLPKGRARKRCYTVTIHGTPAAAWMMTLYRFMGTRRQEKIRGCLALWRSGFSWGTVLCRNRLHRIEGDNILTNITTRHKCRACYEARKQRRAA